MPSACPPIQNQHWNQVRPHRVDVISMFAFTLRCLTKIRAETQWRPHPLDGAQTHPWTVGLTDKGHSPQSGQILLELSMMNSPLMATSSPRVNEWSFHHPAETISWQTSIGSHASINKAMDLARTCIYWPGMEADMTDYIKRCPHMHWVQQPTQLRCCNHHEVPPRPLGKNRCWLLSIPFGEKST